jgi:hypothetical protein
MNVADKTRHYQEARRVLVAAGFAVVEWNDLTERAATLMETFLSSLPGPLGLHTFVDNFAKKASILPRSPAGGLRVIQGVTQAIA